MVKELRQDNKAFFACEACSFVYKERELAEKCQKACDRNKS